MKQLVKLQLPNILGSEKIAIDKAVIIAEEMGFSKERIEDLKTAIAEACINAIEHGNKFDKNSMVGIRLASDDTSLEVTIEDNGTGIDQNKIPKKRIDKDGMPKRRGYGVFLIKKLVNEFSFEKKTDQGNEVRMLIYLNK